MEHILGKDGAKLIVPTELTENTEAYGLKLLEPTDRIDAARHTTESTEMIASATQAIISVDSCLAKRRLFCKLRVDSKSLSP